MGLAGSITSVTAHVLDLEAYDRTRIDGSVLPVDQVLASCRTLLGMTRSRRTAIPFMHPGRADVIGAGALIWSDIITRVRAEVGRAGGSLKTVVTSEHDILDGIAWSAAERS